MNLGNLFQALRAGWVLKNHETWANRKLVITALTSVLTVAVGIARGAGYDISISDDLLADLAVGIWSVVGVFNAVTTVATNPKMGVQAVGQPRGPTDA